MNTALTTLQNCARECAITLDQARHWVDHLGITITKVGRVRHITGDDAAKLASMARLVASGMSPVEAAATIKASGSHAPEIARSAAPAPDHAELIARLDDIGRSMVALADEVRQLRQENTALRLRLEPPAPVRQIVASSQPMADPLAGLSWYQRLKVQLFEPQRLRRYEM
jgi:hypothetical protein